MKSWDAASSKIRKRKVDIWRELNVELPFDYEPTDPDAYFSSYLEENPPGSPELVLDRVDRDRLWTAEIIITAQKFLHVLRLTVGRAREGHITWASTDAHHSLLLGARCFLATLGVGICQGKHRVHLVDFRPERGSPSEEQKFRKQHKGIQKPVRVLTPNPENMQQKQIFDLFNRMLRLVDHDPSSKFLVENLKLLELGAHKSERNRLLYHSHHWHWLDDLYWPTIEFAVKEEILKGSNGLTRDFHALTLMASLVFRTIKPLATMLLVQDSFFEPLSKDDLCDTNPLSFLV